MGIDLSGRIKSYFSNVPKTIFIFMLIITCLTVTIFNVRKTITVVLDNETIEITTIRSRVKSIFKSNGITVGSKDKISVNMDSKVEDGDKITIKKAVKIEVAVDGKELEILSAEDNVEEMLLAEKIKLRDSDKVLPSKNQTLKNEMRVDIIRVDTEVLDIKEEIDFAKEVKHSDNFEEGTKKVLQEGVKGEKVISTKIVYENGEEIFREKIKEEVLKDPVTEIVALGTLGILRPSRGGKLNYTNVLNVKATAYTADCDPNGVPDDPYMGRTATGTWAKRNPNGYSTIAVDPRVIPLGTKVYVEGYGLAIAEDVGSAIKGNRVDVFMNTYSQTISWGVRYVKVYILK